VDDSFRQAGTVEGLYLETSTAGGPMMPPRGLLRVNRMRELRLARVERSASATWSRLQLEMLKNRMRREDAEILNNYVPACRPGLFESLFGFKLF
jgi:hypothetical protein